jgi:hypothetical protein
VNVRTGVSSFAYLSAAPVLIRADLITQRMPDSHTDQTLALPVAASALGARVVVDDTQSDLLDRNMAINAIVGCDCAYSQAPSCARLAHRAANGEASKVR